MDESFLAEFGRGLRDLGNRAAANLTGGPVDAAAGLVNAALMAYGYLGHGAGLLSADQMPQPVETPVGGSAWLQQKMLNAGLIDGVNPIADALVMAALPLGAMSIAGRAAGVTQRSARVKIRDPQPLPQRPFANDYPNAASAQPEGSRLAVDIEGRPLVAPLVVGRRTVGGADVGLGADESALAARSLGATSREVPAREIGSDAGRFVRSRSPTGDAVREILIRQGLDGRARGGVYQHEFGHMLEDLTYGGAIKVDGIKKELQQVYHDLNAPFRSGKGRWAPENDGYKGEAVDRELIAEAIRAYMRDPNYLKTTAPKTAERIREAINGNENIRRVIQFNSAAGAGLLASEVLDPEAEASR